jgi:predicted transcriptional regulator
LKIAEWFYRAGAVDYIISNIGLSGSSIYDNVYYEISTLSELLVFMYEHKGENKIFIFDEAGIHVSHRRAMKSNNMLMMNLSKLIRKLKCHMFLITQDSKGVDKALRELATLFIHKDTKTTAQVIECLGERETYNIAGITATSIPYDTNDMADFVFDLTVDDMSDVMKLISSNPSVSKFREEINKMVEKNKNKGDDKKDTKSNNVSDTQKQDEYINDNTQDEKNTHDNIIYQSEPGQKNDTIQNIILKYIHDTGGVPARDVADAIGKSKARTNVYLKELKENGLIYSEGTGRKVIYKLTSAGKYYIESK